MVRLPKYKILLFLILAAVTLFFTPGFAVGDDEVTVLKDGEFEVPRAVAEQVSVTTTPDGFRNLMKEVVPRVEEFVTSAMKLSVAPKSKREDVQAEYDECKNKLITDFGEKGIKCLSRFRTPYIIPLLGELTEHKNWWVRREAIFALQRNIGLSQLDRIVANLADENFLVREIAATTIAIFHNIKYYQKMVPQVRDEVLAFKGLKKRKKADLAGLKAAFDKEANPYIRSALEAAILAISNAKCRPIKILDEVVAGSKTAPYAPIAGTQTVSGISRSGGLGKLPVCGNWCYPSSIYPKEVVSLSSDRPLVPLPAQANGFHLGHDCAWMLDGSGVYSIGDGEIRFVEYANDFGIVICGEYYSGGKDYVMTINGHCGIWTFAGSGPVKCRQLIGQVGMSFSGENGVAHDSHNHFGMRNERFNAMKIGGRGKAGITLEGWLIPAEWLGPRVVGKEIKPDSYK